MKCCLPLAIALVGGCLQAAQSGTFDGGRAYEHIRKLVEIGPRVAGTTGAHETREYITNELTALGLAPREQPFVAATPLGPAKMVNVLATIPGPASTKRSEVGAAGLKGPRLVVAGHYDTKLFRDFTFVGANDGGSSTAFLIELARVLKNRRNALPIELLFLDGEEAVVEWQGNDNTYGSRHYVDAARTDGTLQEIRALILVDMIGDRDLRIMRESNSTDWLTEVIWQSAKASGRSEFVDEVTTVDDDHLPFLRAGVPAVDIIDFDYPAWHTREDTLDKVSARSLQIVGEVLLAALPHIESRASR